MPAASTTHGLWNILPPTILERSPWGALAADGALPRKTIDLTPLPAQATEYKPTFRDRIARTMIGDAPPSAERRQFVSGLMGSTGIGSVGLGLLDFTPAGVPLALNDAGKAGDFQGAALAAMPGAGPLGRAEGAVANKFSRFTLDYFGQPVTILQNPSPLQTAGFLNRTKFRAARRIHDPDTGDMFIWDAGDPALHQLVADKLGIKHSPKFWDMIGID